jgi:hypothetical protein
MLYCNVLRIFARESIQHSHSYMNKIYVYIGHYTTSRKVAGSIPVEFIGFFNLPNPSGLSMSLRSSKPVTEMSTRNLLGGKGLQARKADNLTAICEPMV